MKNDYKGLFSDKEIAVTKNLVKEYRKTWPCLKQEGFDDLLQECLVHWLSISNGYDPTRGASQNTFMGQVIRNKLVDLVREKQADKRRIAYTALSLHGLSENDEDSHALENTIIDTRHLGFSQIELHMDVTNVLKQLTPKQQNLCNLLKKDGLNIKEVSQCLNTPRSTIYDELKRIRKIFLKEGLGDEYLE